MFDVCGNQSACAFFKKYSTAAAAAHQASIQAYCQGPRCGACEREVYRKAFDAPPPDELLPTGAMGA